MEVTVYNFNFQGLAISCVEARGPLIFKKSRSHLNVLGTRRVTQSKFHTQDPKILGTTIKNLVALNI